jgi:uncharacterized protein (DUF736 family)
MSSTTFLGTFKKTGNAFTGTIHTLAFKAQIDLLPIEGSSEGAPAYRVYHKEREIGAAWVKRARKSDQEFLSLKVRDLAFGSNPVYPALVQSTRDAGSWNLLLNGNSEA